MFHRTSSENRSYARNGIAFFYSITGLVSLAVFMLGVRKSAPVFEGSHLLVLGLLGVGSGLLVFLKKQYAAWVVGVYTAFIVFFSVLGYMTIHDPAIRLLFVIINTVFLIAFLYLLMNRKYRDASAIKVFYGISLCIVLFSLLVFYGDNLRGGKIRNAVLQVIDQNCSDTDRCIIDMRTIADDFEWDTLYAFNDSVDSEEMKRELSTETSGKREFSYQIVFSNKGKVVLREYEEMSMDDGLSIVFEGTFETPYYAKYSKEESVFSIVRGSGYGDFLLVPVL